MTLIDPDKTGYKESVRKAFQAERAGTSAIMLGGSLGVNETLLDAIVKELKRKGLKIPIILFPGSVGGLSKYADAVWFISVLTSISVYHIIGAQVQAAVIVKKYGIEPLSLAYIIMGEGGAAGYVSYSRPIPFNRPEIAAAYALAAQYLGFSFVYLEGGSGGKPIPEEVIRRVSSTIDIPLIVGGGIKNRELARKAARAGANIIVTGTVVEEAENEEEVIRDIIEGIREGVKERG